MKKILGSLALAGLVACGAEPTAVDDAPVARYAIVSGDAQTGPALLQLPQPLVVEVTEVRCSPTDSDSPSTCTESPVRNALVNFEVVEGGGSVFAGSSLTNNDGRASDWWTMGGPGPQTVEVRAIDPSDFSQIVHATFHAHAEAFAYVTNAQDDEVAVIDLSSNTVTATLPTDKGGPAGAAITPDGAFAYVTHEGSDEVSVIDLATNAVTTTVTIASPATAIAITPDGAFAYATHPGGGNVSVIDLGTNTEVDKVTVGSEPTAVAITPNGAFAYVTNRSSHSVSVIDLGTNTVTAEVVTGGPGPSPRVLAPAAIAITPNGAFAYVTNSDDLSRAWVTVVDLRTNTPVAEVGFPLGALLEDGTAIAITPDGAFAYVTDQGARNVWVIDVAANASIGEVAVPAGTTPMDEPTAIAITPDGALAYVADRSLDLVYVIDLWTNTVTAEVSVGGAPSAVAITPW